MAVLEEIKTEALLELNDNQWVRIAISNTEMGDKDLFFKRESGEFLYRGKLYDYKKLEKTTEGFIFYAVEDNKENILVNLLSSSFEENDYSKKHSGSTKVLKNLSKDYLPTTNLLVEKEKDFERNFFKPFTGYFSKGYVYAAESPPDNFLI